MVQDSPRSQPMATVYVSRRLPDPVMAELARRFTLIGQPHDRPATRKELLEAASQADALAVTLTERVDADVLDRAPRLKVVAVYAVGYDNVDVAAATRRGIVVTHTPDVLTEATADLTWALILAVARRVLEGDAMMRSGAFEDWSPTLLLGKELSGATLGIIGFGRIGRAVARRGQAFGMTTLFNTRSAGVPLDDLIERADVLSLHCPLRPETRHLINRKRLWR